MKLPLENNAVILGLLITILALLFAAAASKNRFFTSFFKVVPLLLLCYFIPAIFNTMGFFSTESSESLYAVSSKYLLPASLVLLCLSVDMKSIMKLGPKALIMFFTATIGVVIGGPLALYIVSLWAPEVLGGDGPEAIWRGLSTICGSWIGGGANQTAMKEIAQCSDNQFQAMIVVDVVVANIWMAVLLFGAGISDKLDKKLKADNSSVEEIKTKMDHFQSGVNRVASFKDLLLIVAVAFGSVGLSHLFADMLAPYFKEVIDAELAVNPDSWLIYVTTLYSGFFWIVVFATIFGVVLSFTKLRNLEGAGASKIGSVFIYILVATIGMKMDILQLVREWSVFKYILAIGFIWMLIHVIILLIVAKIVKAPFFFVAVGSQANIGGAASAPVVASAFSPSLAPVGVLLAVLGYVIGTIGGIIGMELMRAISL
jgi:uncharacterized membrane protein